MKVLITGATGFLGRATVTTALAAGHDVVALHRPASAPPPECGTESKLHRLPADLREPGDWCLAMEQVEAVIHCAAVASGDLHTQLSGTVLGTENLLHALPTSLRRFVQVSSLSVYDFDKPRLSGSLTEDTPLEVSPQRRDAYTQTKLLQERLIRRFALAKRVPLVVVRPGAIYGPDRTWDWGRALKAGPFDLIFAPLAPMRLVYVGNCAKGLVAALTCEVDRELCINLVDVEQPSHWRYHRLARRSGAELGIPVPVPYWSVLALGAAARLASKLFFGGRARLPELLDLPRQRVRWRPLRYCRKGASELLKGAELSRLEQVLAQLTGDRDLASTPRGRNAAQ